MQAQERVSTSRGEGKRLPFVWNPHKSNLDGKISKLAFGIIMIGIMIVTAGLGQSIDPSRAAEHGMTFKVETIIDVDTHGVAEKPTSQTDRDFMTIEQLTATLQINKYTLLLLLKNASPEAFYEENLLKEYQRINRISELQFITIDCDQELEIGSYYGILTHSKFIFSKEGLEPLGFPRKTFSVESLQAWIEAMVILHMPIQHVRSLRHAIHEISPRREAALVYFGPEGVSDAARLEDLKILGDLRNHIQSIKFCYSDRSSFGLDPLDDTLAVVYVLLDNGTVVQERIRQKFTPEAIIKAAFTARTPWVISLNAEDKDLLDPPQMLARLPFLILFYKDMQPAYQEFRSAALHYKNQINFFFCTVRIQDCQAFSKAFGVIQVPMIVMSHPEIDRVRIFFTDLMSTMRIVKFVESTFAEMRVALKKRRPQSP